MGCGLNLIVLLVLCAKIVVSLPYGEEEVRQRVHRDSDWPANQDVNQQYQRPRYAAQPQTVDSVGNTYQQPNNREYRQQKGLNNRLRNQPALSQVPEKNEPFNGNVNDKQVYDYRYPYRPENELGSYSAGNNVVNNRPLLRSVGEPYRHPTQYEQPEVINERYPPNVRHEYYQQEPFNGVQREFRRPDERNLKNVRRVEISEPRRPDEVSRVAGPNASFNPAHDRDQMTLNTPANDFFMLNKNRYNTIQPNATEGYVDKLPTVTRNDANYVFLKPNDVLPSENRRETIQRLQVPVDIPDIDKLRPANSENDRWEFTNTKTIQQNSQLPAHRTEYINSQHSYEYDIPKNSDTISEIRPYVRDTSVYNPQSLAETADTYTKSPRLSSSANNGFSNIEITNDVPTPYLHDVKKNNFISSPSQDVDYAPIADEMISASSIMAPPIKSTLLTEYNINNPSISHIRHGNPKVSYEDEFLSTSPIEVPYNTDSSSFDNNVNNPSKTITDITNSSPVVSSNNVFSSRSETSKNNPLILPGIAHLSGVLNNNDETKILATENSNDALTSSQDMNIFHLNSMTLSSMGDYIGNIAGEDEVITISPIEIPYSEKLGEIQGLNKNNIFIEPYIENISSEIISRVSEDENISVAASAPEPIQRIFGNALKDIIGTREPNNLVTENENDISLEKDMSSPLEGTFINHREATVDEITNPRNEDISTVKEIITNRREAAFETVSNPVIENTNPFEGSVINNRESMYDSESNPIIEITSPVGEIIINRREATLDGMSNIIVENISPVEEIIINRREAAFDSVSNPITENTSPIEEIIINRRETTFDDVSKTMIENIAPVEEIIINRRADTFDRTSNPNIENISPVEETIVNRRETTWDSIPNPVIENISPVEESIKNHREATGDSIPNPIKENIRPVEKTIINRREATFHSVSNPENINPVDETIINRREFTSDGIPNTIIENISPVEETIINRREATFDSVTNPFTENTSPVDETIINRSEASFDTVSYPIIENISYNPPVERKIDDTLNPIIETQDLANLVEENNVRNIDARSDDIPNTFIVNESYESTFIHKSDDIPETVMENVSNFNLFPKFDITEDYTPVDDDSSTFVETENVSNIPIFENDAPKTFTRPVSNSDGFNLFEERATGNIPNSLVKNEFGDNTIAISHTEVPAEKPLENELANSEPSILYESQSLGNTHTEIEPRDLPTITPVNSKVPCTGSTVTDQSTDIAIDNEQRDKSEVWFKTDADFWQKLSNGNINYDVVYLFQNRDHPVVEKTLKTTVYPNGTVVQEIIESTWECKDTKPIVIESRRKIENEDSDVQDGIKFE